MACKTCVALAAFLVNWASAVRFHASSEEELNTTNPFLTQRREWHVFVRKVELLGSYFTLGLAWHTETLFCTLKQNQFAPLAAENLADKLFVDQPSVTPEEVQVFAPHFDQCFVSGFAGLGPIRHDFDDDSLEFFHGPYGNNHLVYVGHKEFVLGDLIFGMRRCGNWDFADYHFLYHNCNYFTNALMKALDFVSPTFQLEKATGRAWIPRAGYYDPFAETCRGTKCTGRPHDPAKSKRKGKCDAGVCYDGSEYLPETHTCASQKKTLLERITGMRGSPAEQAANDESEDARAESVPWLAAANRPHTDERPGSETAGPKRHQHLPKLMQPKKLD